MTAHTNAPSRKIFGRTWSEWLVSLPTITLLLMVLVIGTGELVHGQLLSIGESMFGNKDAGVQYFMLRAEPEKPECDPAMNVDAEVARRMADQGGAKSAVDDLFEAEAIDPAVLRRSLEDTLAQCKEKHAWYQRAVDHTTPTVRAYRAVETSFFGLYKFGTTNRPIILMLLMGITILAATINYEHLSIVPPRFPRDFKLQAWVTLIGSLMALWSSIRYYQISVDAGVPIEEPIILQSWIVIFAAFSLVGLYQVIRPFRPNGVVGEGEWTHALNSLPLAPVMTISSGLYFFLHNHPSGLAIYINSLMEYPTLPLQLALFIWGGMLFKQSRMIDLFMNLMRPWKLSPEFLTYIVLLAAAIPTAYTGGSGAFVMAAGAIIYHEIRAVGGSNQYALAATAMSGSLGVVLKPSLLVVAIVAVNKEVTSNELFHWGLWVFLLTSTLFFIASQWRREQHTITVASPATAIPAMLREVPSLLPYIAVVAAVSLFYTQVLDTPINEISAPIVMPVMMILIVIFDKFLLQRGIGPDSKQLAFAMHRERTAESAIRVGTNETVGHLGAYMFLILLSQAAGGVIERSEIIHLAPDQFASPWTAMAFMATALVVLGMFMEPLGAIFLVSGTLAPLAYKSGIDPVHFWVMVLVAFELGYLMPPVALNQLLARQVVGEDLIDKADAEVAHQSFYRRYERWILPCVVMTVGLMLVSFVPLAVAPFPELAATLKDWMGPGPQ